MQPLTAWDAALRFGTKATGCILKTAHRPPSLPHLPLLLSLEKSNMAERGLSGPAVRGWSAQLSTNEAILILHEQAATSTFLSPVHLITPVGLREASHCPRGV